MGKLCVILMMLLALTGCAAQQTYETVADEMDAPVAAIAKEIYMELPEEAVLPAMECENGTIYFCREFEVSVQTRPSGDLAQTVRQVSGFEPDTLTVVKLQDDSGYRYEFVWTSAAELGEQVNRAAILDDGNYHYILSTSVNADQAQEYYEVFNGLFDSFRLV